MGKGVLAFCRPAFLFRENIMKKNQAITLLSILCVILAAFFVLTFIPFGVGVKNYNSILGSVEYDYDLNGGFSYTASLSEDSPRITDADDLLKTVGSRLSMLGYKSYKISAIKETVDGIADEDLNYSIKVNVKADKNEYGMLDADTASSNVKSALSYGTIKFFGGASSATTEIMNEEKAVADAYYAGEYNDSGTIKYNVAVVFTDYGYKALSAAAEEAGSNFYLKITLGDETLLNSSFSSTSSIVNNTIYITSTTESGARQTALQIKTGGLKYKFDLNNIEESEITPMLGENAVLKTEIALGAVVLAAIIAFIVLFKGYGVVAGLTLLTFILCTIGMMVAVPGIVVSVSGLIGMFFAVVLAADGLIITIKRVSEEYKKGKTMKAAVRTGYRRAFMPIVSAHVVSAIVALLAFVLLGGSLNSFGVVLGIATVISFLCNVLIARLFTECLLPLTKKPEKFFNLKRAEE